ncbi:effector-associated constant component EACC1 [Streptomyces sp. NPDC004286]|uniref:effector-associated constant component EACC1 n=1 Tax=Streptomyces sp. NPDC004286 TaxID=3364696 RepID=UPI003690D6DD
MHIRIVSDEDEQALTDLRSWLRRDPDTRTLAVTPVSGTGPTMNVLEALDIVLGHAVDIANFAIAYATWRSTRATGGRTGARTLAHGGSTNDIGDLTAEQLTELIRALEREAGSREADDPDEDLAPS